MAIFATGPKIWWSRYDLHVVGRIKIIIKQGISYSVGWKIGEILFPRRLPEGEVISVQAVKNTTIRRRDR